MKKILVLILTLLISTVANADELENVLNKVYGKSSKLAEDYISNLLEGPGDTEVSIGTKNNKKPTGSIMIVRPYSITENSIIFYQAQLNSYAVEGDARQSLNYGVGKRFLSNDKSHFWGINSFVDLDIETNSRLGFGSEFKASTFNVNGNYYLAALGGRSVGSNTERVLDGHDFNISGQAPFAPWANINYNNYVWRADKATKDSEGDIYSVTADLTNNITLEFGRDDNNITHYNNFVKLIYLPGSIRRPNHEDDGFSSTAFQGSDVSKDMLTKVKRSNIITLEIESSGVVMVNGN